MAISLQIPQQTDAMSPLGALIAHFNSSSKSVKVAFYKLLSTSLEKERQEQLEAKVAAGVNDIKAGRGISRRADESTEQFFERLCTE